MVLALLVVMAYGYWYQTNDRKIRRRAEHYLGGLTGGRVRIHKARFNFFGKISLEGVRLYIPGADTPVPLFRAEKMMMRHRPWELLLTGRVEPIEIVCINPVITLEYEAQSGAYRNWVLIVRAWSRRKFSAENKRIQLPKIRVRGGRLVAVDVSGSDRHPAGDLPLEVLMIPMGQNTYSIVFEENRQDEQRTMHGRMIVDFTTGAITQVSGILPLESMDRTLPHKYRRWIRQYGLTGDIRLKQIPDPETRQDIIEADLIDVSMKLPDEEGSLEMLHVSGKLRFDLDGVTFDGISGRIPQAGGARFEMSGRYDGYEANAPYQVSMNVQDMTIPLEATGGLAKTLENLRRTFNPEGRLNVSVNFNRDVAGKINYIGLAEPNGMSFIFKHFPYLIENVRGAIAFSPGRIELKDLTARRGDASYRINGLVTGRRQRFYDVTVNATDAQFDQELQDAIPAEFQPVLDALSPSGTCAVNVRVYRSRNDPRQRVDVHLALDGKGSICYEKFPYRINQLVGDVYINGRDVRIISVKGRRRDTSFTIDGDLEAMGTTDWRINLTVVGESLPLDDVLAGAIDRHEVDDRLYATSARSNRDEVKQSVGDQPGWGQAVINALRPKGSVSEFTARIWRQFPDPLDYSILAKLADVTFNLEKFPYELSKTRGIVTIRPGLAVVEKLSGVHADSNVTATGQVLFGKNGLGFDMSVSATNVAFDEDLRRALPDRFKRIWTQLAPGGHADMSLSLQRNLPDRKDDYSFELCGRNMSITHSEFPYPLRGITGRVRATARKVILEDIRCSSGPMQGTLEGVFLPGADGGRADLRISAANIPIDEDLLKALPDELAPLTRRFEVGGSCDIDLERLELLLPGFASTDNSTTTRPQTNPQRASWKVCGSIAVRGAAVKIGLGTKTITGWISGEASRDQTNMAIDANVNLDSVVMGNHKVTDLSGRLTKASTSSVMKLDNIEARSHGGWLAGFAVVELTNPLKYGVNLTVDAMRLEELFGPESNGGGPDRQKVTGLLTGNLQLTEQVGNIDSRLAKGALQISEARLYKLPVLLDLLTVVYLALPGQTAFTEGEFIYYLRSNSLIFEEIYLRGPQISLVGSGTMEMDTKKLKLTFLAGPPGKLPRLGGLADELLTGIFREIMEIEVTGTLAKPKTRTRTLRSVEVALRKLLQPQRERE